MSLPDIVLYPHCDLHVVVNGPPLRLRVDSRSRKGPTDPLPLAFTLVDCTAQCVFEFFAPHSPVGSRLDNCPTVDPTTGLVTATVPGVYLFQVRFGNHYHVGRLQVHNQVLGWWFGNGSITTALDANFAHAQPSIYASFTPDAGTDPVGDITGHGYVTLTSNHPARFVVTPAGRLRGVAEGDATLPGEFLGVDPAIALHTVNN